ENLWHAHLDDALAIFDAGTYAWRRGKERIGPNPHAVRVRVFVHPRKDAQLGELSFVNLDAANDVERGHLRPEQVVLLLATLPGDERSQTRQRPLLLLRGDLE